MKKGKIILGAVAVIVTAASSLAMKAANKFNAHRLYYQFTSGGCALVINAFKVTNPTKLVTITDQQFTVSGTSTPLPAAQLYTQRTAGQSFCLNPTNHYQLPQ